MDKREVVTLKEWNSPPVIYQSIESAKQALRGRKFWYLDDEPMTDESEYLGPSSRVQVRYRRFWDDEFHYTREKDMEYEDQENFSGIVSEITTTKSSLKQIAIHIAGHIVVGGLLENDPFEGHRFNWATVLPNPPLKNWRPYLGMCDDKFANEPLDCFIENRSDANKLAVYTLGGKLRKRCFPTLADCQAVTNGILKSSKRNTGSTRLDLLIPPRSFWTSTDK
jgi:hypothetical protein